MKLGTQTGSMTNHIMSRMTKGQPEPVVGMGCTILCWSDRLAATIYKVETVRRRTVLHVREDKATRTDTNGMSEMQAYIYESNPAGRLHMFRQNLMGGWDEIHRNEKTGRYVASKGNGLRIGDRAAYHDFSF